MKSLLRSGCCVAKLELTARRVTCNTLKARKLFAVCCSLAALLCSARGVADAQGGEWRWMAGSNTVPAGKGQPGVYGTEYQFAPSNSPGARNSGALSWTDQSGKLWLFGGFGYDSSGTAGYLGDLWVFDPSVGANGEWAWMGGSSTLSTNSVGYTASPVSMAWSISSRRPMSPVDANLRLAGLTRAADSGSSEARGSTAPETRVTSATFGSLIPHRARTASGRGWGEIVRSHQSDSVVISPLITAPSINLPTPTIRGTAPVLSPGRIRAADSGSSAGADVIIQTIRQT